MKLNSLEIKFLIKKEDVLKNPEYNSLENNKLIFTDKNDNKKVDLNTLKSKLRFSIESSNDIDDFSIFINNTDYQNFSISENNTETIELDIDPSIKDRSIEIDISLSIIQLMFRTWTFSN